MTSFIGQRSLQPTSVHVQRWQADVLEQDEGGGAVQSKHLHSQNQDNASLSLEQAWHVSPAWMQDLNGEDAATASNSAKLNVSIKILVIIMRLKPNNLLLKVPCVIHKLVTGSNWMSIQRLTSIVVPIKNF